MFVKTSHLSNRAWRNNATTCWIRGCDENAISLGYRLFRRSSVTRAFWSETVAFDGCDSRDYIAATLLRPTLCIDGNQWCALYGENLMEGIAGFGDTPELAMCDFDNQFRTAKVPRSAT